MNSNWKSMLWIIGVCVILLVALAVANAVIR